MYLIRESLAEVPHGASRTLYVRVQGGHECTQKVIQQILRQGEAYELWQVKAKDYFKGAGVPVDGVRRLSCPSSGKLFKRAADIEEGRKRTKGGGPDKGNKGGGKDGNDGNDNTDGNEAAHSGVNGLPLGAQG